MRITVEALSQQQLLDVHQATLGLLEKKGIAIHHAPSRRIFQQYGALVEGEIVRIPQALVTEFLKKIPKSFSVAGRNPSRTINLGAEHKPVLGPAAGAVFVSDLEKGRRPGVLKDFKNLLSLSQSSEYIGVAAAGVISPADLAPGGRHLVQLRETIKISDKPIVGLSLGKKISEDSINMAQIAVGGMVDHYIIGIVNSLSPMAWDERMLEAIWAYAGKRQPLVIACCSMAGFTSPIALTPTLVQNNAENLTGIVLAQLINPGTPVVYGNTSTITDMLTMNLCIGAPEYVLLSTACAQLARFYGIPYRSGGGLTDAKEVDAQAGIEAAINLLFTMANNVDFVLHAMGIMESFLSISYEKWIMDEEIWGRVLSLCREVEDLPDTAVDLISKVGPGGHYLEQPDTVANCRSAFFRSTLSDHINWDSWMEKGKTYSQAAHELCKKRLEDFSPPALPLSVETELKRYTEDCAEYGQGII